MSTTRSRPTQNRFTSGEWAPYMDGRFDHEDYYGALSALRNFLLMPAGGVTRRPGSRFVVPTKATGDDPPPRLIPFQYSDEQAYMLEFGDRAGGGYVRFYRNGGQILGNPTGPELVSNGGFPVDLTGWDTTLAGTGAAAVASAQAQLDAGDGSAAIRQDVTVVADTPYVLSFEIFSNTTKVRVGSTEFGEDILATTAFTAKPGAQKVVIESPTTTMWIEFIQDVATVVSEVDNVSLKLATALEIESPYTADELPALMFAQSADTMYLAHKNHAVYKLTRTSHTDWRLREVSFRPPATSEEGHLITEELTLAAVTGAAQQVTPANSFFIEGDVGRQIVAGDGRGVIVAYTSGTDVDIDILDAFAATAIGASVARLTGSPACTLTPTPAANCKRIGASVTLTATTPASAFRSTDVGKYVRLNDGVVRIKTYTSVSVVTAEVLVPLDATTGTTDWKMEDEAWSDDLGFPPAVGWDPGNRLVFGKGELVTGSVVDDYENLGLTTLDDDAFQHGLRSPQVNVIRWIAGTDRLIVGTTGGPFVLRGADDTPINPTNVDATLNVTDGCAAIAPVLAGTSLLYVDASLRALREFVYNFEEDRDVAPDMLLLAGHMVPQGNAITSIAYQRNPHSIIWATRDDGALLGFTYMRPEKVTAWHRHPIGGDGLVRSVACIPHWDGGRDVLWMVVERTVNMQTVYYVEYLDDDGLYYEHLNLDSAITYDGVSTDSVTGLSHLEGETVKVVGDGMVLDDEVVSGGAITISRACEQIEVGLGYTSTLTTMRPEIPTGAGSSMGVMKRHAEVVALLYQTGALKVGGKDVDFRNAEDPLDAPVPLFDGLKPVPTTGWSRDGKITLECDKPLPCTILMLAPLTGTGA